MKLKIKSLLLILSACLLVMGATAQTNPPALPPGVIVPSITNAGSLGMFALNILPAWDPNATNTFLSGEMNLEVSGVFHSVNAAGVSPYASVGGGYWFSKVLGVQGEVVTLSNGSGSSGVDSVSLDLAARAISGNIAGYVLAGGGRDYARNKWGGEIGVGIEYRYATGIGVFVDTRYRIEGTHSQDNDFLTRVGATVHFGGKRL